MDTLLRRQGSLGKLIAYFVANTRKAGRDDTSAGFLRSRIDLLEKYWHDFRRNHDTLINNPATEGCQYFAEDLHSSVELQYTRALGTLYDLQSKDQVADATAIRPALQSAPTVTVAHLPKINLPTFSGRLGDWETFRDIFRSLSAQ